MAAGVVIAYAGSLASVPAGWLSCEGQYVSKAAYPQLWAAIGETWGAATPTEFKLPDLRLRYLRGIGSNSDGQNGATIGNVGNYQGDVFKQHQHGIMWRKNDQYVIESPYHGIVLPSNDHGRISGGASPSGSETRPKTYGINWLISVN